MDKFAIAMYCKDAKYADSLDFPVVSIDRNALINLIPYCFNIGKLLSVSVISERIREEDLLEFTNGDRIDLLKFVFDMTNITIESIRENYNELFIAVCIHGAAKSIKFYHQQGMLWTDISTDLSNNCVRWFLSVINSDA
jgi:hypothetical protein